MDEFDDWEMIEWVEPSPDVVLEEIKQKATQDIGKIQKTINRLDKVVRLCQDWQRKNASLCPRCRVKYYNVNVVSSNTKHLPKMDTEHSEKQKSVRLSKNLADKIKDKDSSTISMSTKGMQFSTKTTITSEDFQLALGAKNSAFEILHKETLSENENFKTSIEKLTKENEQLLSNVSSTESENKNLKKENCKLKEKNEELESNVSSTESENKNLKKQNCKLKEKNEELESNVNSTESENENLKKENGKLKEKNEELVSTVSSNIHDLQKVREDIVLDKETTQAEMRARSEEWGATQNELTMQITDLTNQLAKHTNRIGELENNLGTKDDELCMVKRELAEAKRPRLKDIVLGIRTERSGMGKTMVDMVHKELSGQLQSLLVKENVRLTVKQCTAATDVPKGLLAVLCLDMSRVGTNIKDALAGIKVNRDVFVIVFHHTSKENLSSLTPTRLRITGSELRQLGAIIDMVFSSDSGIYECDVNNTAIAKIASHITKYS